MTSFLQRARGAAGSFSYAQYEKEISLPTPRLCKKTIGKGDKKMKSKKAVRSALGMSVLSIALCAAMLIGTTFAWFTDTASTAVNKIQAGTLDVALEMKDSSGNWVSAEGKTLDFVKAEGAGDEEILWEPGCTYNLPELKIVNNGNLALKYMIKFTGIKGDAKLNEVIEWTIEYGAEAAEKGGEVLPGEYVLLPAGDGDELTISGHMKETAGNEYQGLSIDGIAITVYATQYTYEYDSKDNQYDKESAYKGSQEFTSGEHTLNKGGVALNPDDVAVKVSGEGTKVTITGGYYDGGSGGNNRCIQVDAGATVIIKDGTFTVGGDATGLGNSVVLCNGGTVEIEGGFFQTDYAYRNFYYVLNQQNGNPGTITVKGGTFVNYDPSKGDDNLHGNFVAEGYSVVSETKANGDVWYTVIEGAYKEPASQEELDSAISSNTKATVKLGEGTYTLPGELSGKDITVVGTKDTVIDMKEKTNSHAENVAFEGVTVNFGTSDYKGFQHTGKLTYKDCTITGKQFLYGENVEFDNCTFVQDAVDYNVWTYGAGKVLFKDCVFDCKGKAVLIYNEGALAAQTVEFQNCEFNASSAVRDKAAIEIDSRFTSYNVIIDKATADQVTGFGSETASGSSVWNVKAQVKPTTVTVNGVTVYSK